jgi:hypothetical protein
MPEKEIIGIVEKIKVIGEKSVDTLALCDTGATLTSVGIILASKAQLGPIVRITKVKNPSLKTQVKRPVVRAKIKIKNRVFDVDVNIQDRSHMTFPVIIGRNILSGNFIVDPSINGEMMRKKMESMDIDKERTGE